MTDYVLRQHTRVFTPTTILKVRKGTRVFLDRRRNVIRFDGIEGVEIGRIGTEYLVNIFQVVHRVEFPKGGRVPFPMSLL